jgi:N-methylhydantoinase B
VETIGDTVNVDFTGTDPVSRWGINVPIIYTKAYACYAMKCVVAPDIPNNWASLEPFTVSSPVNILNAERPAPVSACAMSSAIWCPIWCWARWRRRLPGRILAEGAGALWNIHMSVRPVAGGAGGGRRS